ncbi:actin-like ATPase domain-containing protein [Rhizodiscina lignyota]|uniref:Actin-like ATPase domain-containing protein n=1 Tax=Rhizodiscina lignyota TaxID=1504668 RepID=A0A9P4IBU2_9PEZI|nr:actin-like ATPase domain-containing protein [Rhizodiscina lignyota]
MATAASSTPDYFTRKVSTGRIRPTLSGIQNASSPHTPFNRSLSSFYNSPSSGFRNDDENNVVIELGSRFMRIGMAGEALPRCIMSFGPDDHHRVGDYRQWMPGYNTRRKRKRGEEWGQDHELWRNDVRELDLGLVEDKLERAARKADGEVLMLDDRKKRLTVILASVIARPLLSVTLSTLFNIFQAPSITILPSPIACAASSGLRSALVLDIGWAESTATAIYEYREICQRRSVRAARTISEAMAELLDEECTAQAKGPIEVSFEEAEEVLTRLAWCKGNGDDRREDESQDAPQTILLPLPPSEPSTTLEINFSRFSEPAETAFFGENGDISSYDAHDLSLSRLLYNALLALPVDVRKVCMARIVITGGVSNIPGIKARVIEELKLLVKCRGWDPIRNYGKATKRANSNPRERNDNTAVRLESNVTESSDTDDGTAEESNELHQPAVAAAFVPQEQDPILERLAERAAKQAPPTVEGRIRAVETLGAWAGGSLMAALRIKGVVEVERESFLQHGLAGASKEKEVSSKAAQRQSLGPGARSAGAERASWTLGIWA